MGSPEQELNTNQNFTFIVGEKTIGSKKYSINFLINETKEQANRYIAPLLDIIEINDEKQTKKGNIKAECIFEGKTQNIYIEAPDVAKVCYLLIILGFDVLSIDDSNKSLSEKQSQRLISTITDKIAKTQKDAEKKPKTPETPVVKEIKELKQTQTIEQVQEMKTPTIESPETEGLVEMGNQILSEIETLEKNLKEAKIEYKDLQDQKTVLQNQLKTPSEELKHTIEDTLRQMEKTEMKILAQNEKEEIKTGIEEQKETLTSTEGEQPKALTKAKSNRANSTRLFVKRLLNRSIVIALIEISLITYYYLLSDKQQADNGLNAMIKIGIIGIAYFIRNQFKRKKIAIQILALIVLITITYLVLQYMG